MSHEEQATPLVILIAPNLSGQMGGEAIKALQIYEQLVACGIAVHQITHVRVRGELSHKFPDMRVSYIEDSWFQMQLCQVPLMKWFMTPIFMYEAARTAKKLIKETPYAIVHYTSPISPVSPQFRIEGVPVIVGPLNGNIHHPPAFRNRELWEERVRRMLLVPAQVIHRLFFSGKQTADVLLVAGGERTRKSLRLAGCRDVQFRETLDSGVPNSLRDQPPIEHVGRNLRFVQHGRLVSFKGIDLTLKALAQTRNPVELDVIGRGPMRAQLERLTDELGLRDRVRFTEWISDPDALSAILRRARAFVFPSMGDANGIVVQEAMMMGLPVIGLDWGGQSLLVTPECGILVPPTGEDDVVKGLAEAMDELSEDGELADRMGRGGRAIALERGFAWADLIQGWIAIYHELSEARGWIRQGMASRLSPRP
jgi:glycosyltransferase involved in cell wall biosynthesis